MDLPYETTALTLQIFITICMMSIVGFLFVSWPFYFFFVFFRRKQIHHAQYDALTMVTSHVALTNFFTAVYGIILPAMAFICIRSHRYILDWEFSRSIHTGWRMGLACIVMVWLAARLIESFFSSERPRFSGMGDRIFAGLGVAVCICYHNSLLTMKWLSSPHFYEQVFFFLLPHWCLLGTTLVYTMALVEAAHSKTPVRRPRQSAWAIAAIDVLLVVSPLMLASVRVSRGQAMKLIEAHIDQINDAAAAAELDPRLLAGVIYVAQTRDKPAVYGDAFDQLCIAIFQNFGDRWVRQTFPDPKLGLFALRADQQAAVMAGIELKNALVKNGFDPAAEIEFPNAREYNNRPVQTRIKLPDALVEMMLVSPAMDHIFEGVAKQAEEKIRTDIRDSVPVQAEARRTEMFMPTLRFTCGVSRPIWAMVNASSRYAHHNYHCFFLKDHVRDPMVTEFIDIVPDRTRVMCPPLRQILRYTVAPTDMLKLINNDDMAILLGAAMLKAAESQAAAQSPGQDRIAATIQKCPYAHPRDFTRRLQKVMNSPEFARLFQPRGSAR